MTQNRETAERFLMAAQAMGETMLAEMKQRDPAMAENLATTVDAGAELSIAYTFRTPPAMPAIELLLRSGKVAMPVCSVNLERIDTKPAVSSH